MQNVNQEKWKCCALLIAQSHAPHLVDDVKRQEKRNPKTR